MAALPEQWEALLDAIDDDRALRMNGEPSARIPVVAHFSDPNLSAMPSSRGVVDFVKLNPPTWRADIAMSSMEKIVAFNPMASIRMIAPRPLCIVMNIGYEALHPIDQVMDAYTAAAQPKELVLLPYDQLGFYAEKGQEAAMAAALDFPGETLPVHGQIGGAVPRSDFS